MKARRIQRIEQYQAARQAEATLRELLYGLLLVLAGLLLLWGVG